MPRNGSGQYNPLTNTWNPPVTGVLATGADFQAQLNDISAAITQSVSKDGQTPMTANLPMGNNSIVGIASGTAASPSISANGDTNTGLYFPAADTVGVAVGGVNVGNFTSTGFSGNAATATNLVNGNATLTAGTAAAPSLTTTGDANTGLYFPAADTVAIATGGVKRVEVDANGNVGVGVTPSAIGAGRWLQILSTSSVGQQANGTANLMNNAYESSGNAFSYIASAGAARYNVTAGVHQWLTAPSGIAGNPITFTQAMTLDANGNLLVGTTSPFAALAVNRAQGGASTIIGVQNDGTVGASTKSGFGFYDGGVLRAALIRTRDGGASPISLETYDTVSLVFGTNNTERARITSDGNLLVGTTIAADSAMKMEVVNYGTNSCYLANNPTSAGTTHTLFAGKAIGVDRFWVLGNGNVQNSNNSYGAISDAKLKENIVDTAPKLDKLLQVRVVNYSLKTDPQFKQIGVIAQELEHIFPSMIEEMPDRDDEGNDLGTVTKSVKYSVFVPMLIKAMQEQQAIIESLTARITALEAK